jgi:hypothetical protein|tara:strand:- start:339 stop:470 length:132 start_codon:yes stop_codon:yes gene_type:complete
MQVIIKLTESGEFVDVDLKKVPKGLKVEVKEEIADDEAWYEEE